jgi:hypothetical protein
MQPYQPTAGERAGLVIFILLFAADIRTSLRFGGLL